MAQTIKLKRSLTQNVIPAPIALALGELAINTYDGRLFLKKSVSGVESIVDVGNSFNSTLPVINGGTGVTALTGIVKGNGASAFTAAAAGVDFVAPGGALGTPSSGNLANCTGYPAQPGDRVLRATLTASNSAALADTTSITTGYSAYEIEFINLVPATTLTTAYFRVYSGGVYQAANYNSSGMIPSNYYWNQTAAQAQLSWTSGVGNAAAAGGLSGLIRVSNPAGNTTSYKNFYGVTNHQNQNGGTQDLPNCVGFRWVGGLGTVTGFQFFFSSGNIASGAIKVWGIV